MEGNTLLLNNIDKARLELLAHALNETQSRVLAAALATLERQIQMEDQGMITCYVVPDRKGNPTGRHEMLTKSTREWLAEQ